MATHLKKLNHKHEEILAWMLLNPQTRVREIAARLGYSEGWVYAIVNSDAFQARYTELREKATILGVLTVKERISIAQSMAVDRLMQKVEDGAIDANGLLDVVVKLGKLLDDAPGFGKGLGGRPGMNFYGQANIVVEADTLREMREILYAPREEPIEQDTAALAAPAPEVQTG